MTSVLTGMNHSLSPSCLLFIFILFCLLLVETKEWVPVHLEDWILTVSKECVLRSLWKKIQTDGVWVDIWVPWRGTFFLRGE